VLPMITGRKRLAERVPRPRIASLLRALLVLAGAIAAAVAIAMFT
jgi:hypothetical protein